MNLEFGDKVLVANSLVKGIFLGMTNSLCEILSEDKRIFAIESKHVQMRNEAKGANASLPYGVCSKYSIDESKFPPGGFISVITPEKRFIGTIIESNDRQLSVTYYDENKKSNALHYVRWQDLVPVNGTAKMIIKPVTVSVGAWTKAS